MYNHRMNEDRPRKNETINIRVLPQQRDLIDHAAALLDKSRSDFMLEVACERAQAVVLDQVFFKLDSKRFLQFSAMLDAPTANVKLDKLLMVRTPWERS